jgi:hypothetical protein
MEHPARAKRISGLATRSLSSGEDAAVGGAARQRIMAPGSEHC